MIAVVSPTVGRDAVLARARAVLDGPGAVLLEGPAGIGKTAVWSALRDGYAAAGRLVLSAAPTESERSLPYAALADLLHPLAGAVADLPGPQRLAAEVVLLAADAGTPIDERAVGAATRSLLETALAGDRPVLVAVDDAPWLDPASERALRFALRRLAPRLSVLVAVRSAGPDPVEAPLGLEPTRLALPPLGVGALHHVLRSRLDVALNRPLLARIARDSGGNPLLAIELARAVLRLPELPGPGEDLPVAASVQQLLADSLAALPPDTRAAVRLAALLTVPTAADLAAAGVAPAALEPAEEAGLLDVGPAAVRFAHPLHAAAVRAGIPAGVRRRLQRELAGAVADPDERARLLARATVAPDAAVAAELEAAAGRQRARGAPEVAAELHDRAAELTPADDPAGRGRRRVAALRCRFDSGDYAATETGAVAVAGELTGDARAEALLMRAVVAYVTAGYDPAIALAGEALAAAPAGSRLAGRVHAHLALFWDERPEESVRHADTAVALLPADGPDRELLCGALFLRFRSAVRAGHPPDPALLERALALEGDTPSWLAGTVPASWYKATDQHGAARQRLHRVLAHARAIGDAPLQLEALLHLAETEIQAGRYADAELLLAEATELGEQLGTGLVEEGMLLSLLAAHRGRLAEAGAAAQAGIRRGEEQGDRWQQRFNLDVVGVVALSAGRYAEAAAAYGRIAAHADSAGIVEPLGQRYEADWIEACVGAGDLATAAAVLDRLAQRHARLPRPWTALGLARGRVLLASATGSDVDGPLAGVDAARAAVPADVVPLDRARSLLVAGMAHRRARRKAPARAALTAAAAELGALGAAAWAARAADELARVGPKAAAPDGLTPTEERVARLAAQGRTNRAIAEALFVSPKTVEANLARVYRKLGISSRAELGSVMVSR
jgi:DNA-binding CsgD family transcriptional regulator